jgi:hypothetical protein
VRNKINYSELIMEVSISLVCIIGKKKEGGQGFILRGSIPKPEGSSWDLAFAYSITTTVVT